jgi:hypothetical protein
MAKHEGGFFWGVLLGAAAAAIAGAVAVARSFRSSKDGGRSWVGQPRDKDELAPGGDRSSHFHPEGMHDVDK